MNYKCNVSVVIPLYNPILLYFKECLDSLIDQDYKNFEIIISDNHSDNEYDILNLLNACQKNLNITYIKCNIKGIFSNLNNAIRNSNGEFIQILCQDDILLESHIRHSLNIFKENPDLGMVFSQFEVINEISFRSELEKIHNERFEIPNYIYKKESWKYFLTYGCMPGNLSPVMIKRDVVNKIGPFNPELKYAGDFDFWARLSSYYDIFFNKSVTLLVRRHDYQASKTISQIQLIEDRIKIYNNLIENANYEIISSIYKYLSKSIGTQHLHYLVVNSLQLKIKFKEIFKILSLLNNTPFNLAHIIKEYFYKVLNLERDLNKKLFLHTYLYNDDK